MRGRGGCQEGGQLGSEGAGEGRRCARAVELLLAAGADTARTRGAAGETPLHRAAARGFCSTRVRASTRRFARRARRRRSTCADRLVAAGGAAAAAAALARARDVRVRTLLMRAAAAGHARAMEVLLEAITADGDVARAARAADVDAEDASRATALLLADAADGGHARVVELLLVDGALVDGAPLLAELARTSRQRRDELARDIVVSAHAREQQRARAVRVARVERARDGADGRGSREAALARRRRTLPASAY